MTDWAAQENAAAAFDILLAAETIVGVIIIASAIFITIFWRRQKAKHEVAANEKAGEG